MCSMELNVNEAADARYTKPLQFTGSTGRKKILANVLLNVVEHVFF